MNNKSSHESSSLGGGSRQSETTRSKLSFVRVEELMEMFGSDDEDSEDRDKISDNELDNEDVPQLPADVEEFPARGDEIAESVAALVTIQEENTAGTCCLAESRYAASSRENSNSRDSEISEQRRFALSRKISEPSESPRDSESLRFTDNFSRNEPIQSETFRASSFPSASTIPQVATSSSLLGTNRRSNVKLEIPESSLSDESAKHPLEKSQAATHSAQVQERNERNKYALTSSKSESTIYPSKLLASRPQSSKFEPHDANYYSSERNLHSGNFGQSEESSTLSDLPGSIETPMKSDQPANSSRPAPSILHTSIFQTPQGSKFGDYSKNSVQTPATIFGNWSQRHMVQTPLQSRSTPIDPVRQQSSALLTQLSYVNPEDRDRQRRKPLGDSIRSTQHPGENPATPSPPGFSSSSRTHESGENHNHGLPESAKDSKPRILATRSDRCSSEKSMISYSRESWSSRTLDSEHQNRRIPESVKDTKPKVLGIHTNPHSSGRPTIPYISESSIASWKHESGDNKVRGIGEIIVDSSVKKSGVMGMQELKENRHPQLIEKSSTRDETPKMRASEIIHHPQLFDKSRTNEEPSSIRVSKSTKSSATSFADEGSNEDRLESRPNINVAVPRESHEIRSNNSSHPTLPTTAASTEEKKVTGRNPNFQASIPSSIQKPRLSEIVTVKGKDYFVLNEMGKGMSGKVLRVQDLRSEELRAIKIVNMSVMEKEIAQGCLQEITMLHKLQAPCVVKMFDYEIKFPMLYVVMEMGDTDFRSLLSSMSERKNLPLTMILYYWTEILTAVKHIHDNGVIHSDLKPANFLLVRGRLKLIDFGIASKLNPDMTSVVKNTQIGTLNYISPEALTDIGDNGSNSPTGNKFKISCKSDVWSLGCILYSLIYGHTPFHHVRPQAKFHAITNPNAKISFEIPAGSDAEPPPPILVDVMRKCLKRNPKERPSVAELLQIPYVTPTKREPRPAPIDLPPHILLQIQKALTESDWREFTDIMEAKRNQC